MTQKRGYGSGSVFYRSKGAHAGRWEGKLFVALPDGKPLVRTVVGKTEEEATERLDRLRSRVNVIVQSKRPDSGTPLAGRRTRFIRQILGVARENSWPDDYTAHAISAALAQPRVKANIFGPCVYCGTWLATTVDHVIPRAAGGGNEAENLVSACHSCNASKNDTALDDWRRPDLGLTA